MSCSYYDCNSNNKYNNKSFYFSRCFHFYLSPYSAQEPSYITGNLLLITVLARPKTQAVIPLPQLKANFSFGFMPWFMNIFSNSAFFLKVLFSEFIIFENGRFFDPFTCPFLNFFLAHLPIL